MTYVYSENVPIYVLNQLDKSTEKITNRRDNYIKRQTQSE